jgi:pimeloyl-ACP methyl ester carboxylesterase
MSKVQWEAIAACAILVTLPFTSAAAQNRASPTRIVNVAGGDMRIQTAGLEQRQAGKPVIVLEAGAGNGLETWQPLFAEIAKRAPVVAYDRRGIGQSQPDRQRPTLRRVAESLDALLQQINVAPPYVLVGHSWGGAFIRAFADAHPDEVAGMVFIDASDMESSREEKAAILPESERAKTLAPPTFPPLPANVTPGQRAEFEEIMAETTADYATARTFRQPPGIPVAVVVSTPPGRLQGNGGAILRLHIRRQSEWALTSSKGLFTTAGHVGHFVHRDDPGLVMHLIDHVLTHVK